MSIKKSLLCLVFCTGIIVNDINSQITTETFGKGINFIAKDSTFYTKLNFRIQSLIFNTWNVSEKSLSDHYSNMLIRRSRLKLKGWAVSPKFTYKFEMGLTNRDTGGGSGSEFNKTSNLILDAWVAYNFYKNLSIQFGQGKLLGNRERVISSADLQFVDRSRLNSRFNIDRDVGLQLKNHHYVFDEFLIREIFSFSQGEGRNVTGGFYGGYCYTFRVDALPFGEFSSKGDYVSSSVVRESKPKLSIGITYDINNKAARTRGQLGDFLISDGQYYGKDLNTLFIDLMFKYKGWSVMSEYANKKVEDDDPNVFDVNGTYIDSYYVGQGINFQFGYMFKSNWEIASRFTHLEPDLGEAEDQYTLCLSKYIAGHKLKIQSDITYRDINSTIFNSEDQFFWRTQVEFQF